MRLGARVYVTTKGCEDDERALATRIALADLLAERLADGLLTGYEAADVASEEDLDHADLDPEHAEAVTGGRLPFVYANLTYDADDPRQLDADFGDVIRRFGLQLVRDLTPEDG
jgi:hypothetical protein